LKNCKNKREKKIGYRVKKRQISDLQGVTQFTEQELDELETTFSTVATNGSVNKNEFSKLFDRKYTRFVDDPLIKDQVFAVFDQNGDGTLDFRDYITSLSTLTRGTPKEKIKLLLHIFDSNKDGLIDREDLTMLLNWQFRAMAFKEVETMIKTSVEMAFSEFDLDQDGQLNLDEFILVCCKQPVVVQMFDLVRE